MLLSGSGGVPSDSFHRRVEQVDESPVRGTGKLGGTGKVQCQERVLPKVSSGRGTTGLLRALEQHSLPSRERDAEGKRKGAS